MSVCVRTGKRWDLNVEGDSELSNFWRVKNGKNQRKEEEFD